MKDLRRIVVCASFLHVVLCAPPYSDNFVPQDDDNANDPIISTTHGFLQGQWMTSTHGRTFGAFKGVPYAEPPVGDLRFQPPRSAAPWNGVRKARNHGPQCPQMLFIINEIVGYEDCLYLNIYTPQRDSPERLFPVIFFIHGGAWVLGAGDMDQYLYGPDRFMDEDVVFVTINYRLGALGFLYLENTVAGNMGLKDQAMALQWVKANARSFGGDPSRIVLMGESAGAASGEYHTMNEASRSMISGVIAQSGSALCAWAWTRPEELARRTRRLAGYVRCPDTHDAASVYDCLKSSDARELVKYQLLTDASVVQIPIGISFTPTAEPIGTTNAFLQDCPKNALARMSADRELSVPYLTGYNTMEGAFFSKIVVGIVDGVLQGLVRWKLGLPRESKNLKYLRQKPYFTQPGLPIADQIIGDYEFKAPVIRASTLHARSGVDVFLYYFKFTGSNDVRRIFYDGNDATHMDELSYLFQGRGLFGTLPPIEEPSPEATVSARLIRMWTNFAKTGNPTPKNSTDIQVHWPAEPSQQLVIGNELAIGYPEYQPIWDNFINVQCML